MNAYKEPTEKPRDPERGISEPSKNIDIHRLIDEDNTVKSMMPKNLRSSPPGSTTVFSLENSDKKDQQGEHTESYPTLEPPVTESDRKVIEETAKTTAESKEIDCYGDTLAH